jgi:hypothetical protein
MMVEDPVADKICDARGYNLRTCARVNLTMEANFGDRRRAYTSWAQYGVLCMVVLGSFQLLHAQGRVDPSLPPAPIAFSRTLLLFPGVDTVKDPYADVPPLTVKQKFWVFRRRTVDPSLPVEAVMFAGGSQGINYSPHYGSGAAAFGERVGSYAGSIASSSFFTDALLPSVFHQDPRYFRKGRGSVLSRIWYAFESEAVTRSDSGSLTFNSSGLLGFGMSTALSNAWYPRNSITFGGTMQRYGIKLGISAALNLFREFGGTSNDQNIEIGGTKTH